LKYGYARVSTDDQNAAMQHAALRKVRCQKVFTDEGFSGRTMKRPALQRLLKVLKTGDSVTVWKMDRLGRSVIDLVRTLDSFRDRGIEFRSITEAIDTSSKTAVGRAMWQMISIMAEMESGLIAERTRAGAIAARARGVKFGRKAKLTPQKVAQAIKLIDQDESPDDVAASFQVGRSTLYRAIAEHRAAETRRPFPSPDAKNKQGRAASSRL
jgi:DNA invertase Pin-like site-specific DNA recombinase